LEEEVKIEKGSGIVQLKEVEVTTGEEGEETVQDLAGAKLFECAPCPPPRPPLRFSHCILCPTPPGFCSPPRRLPLSHFGSSLVSHLRDRGRYCKGNETASGTWRALGTGALRLKTNPADGSSRLVMRREGNMEVILNSRLFPDMTCSKGCVLSPTCTHASRPCRPAPAASSALTHHGAPQGRQGRAVCGDQGFRRARVLPCQGIRSPATPLGAQQQAFSRAPWAQLSPAGGSAPREGL